MATQLSSAHTAALGFSPRPIERRPTLAEWEELSAAKQQLLLLIYRNNEMMPITELETELGATGLAGYLACLRPYAQTVYIPGAPRVEGGGPNGVALTVIGRDLVRWGAKHVVR